MGCPRASARCSRTPAKRAVSGWRCGRVAGGGIRARALRPPRAGAPPRTARRPHGVRLSRGPAKRSLCGRCVVAVRSRCELLRDCAISYVLAVGLLRGCYVLFAHRVIERVGTRVDVGEHRDGVGAVAADVAQLVELLLRRAVLGELPTMRRGRVSSPLAARARGLWLAVRAWAPAARETTAASSARGRCTSSRSPGRRWTRAGQLMRGR